MPRRYYAQRKHIIHALDALLYQLFCLSFYLSPSLLNMFLRLSSQLVCSTTRELSPTFSLRHFFFFPLFSNSFSVWNHASTGPGEGRAVILDFVGLAYAPSKFQLLFLDFTIIFFQLLLCSISFEIHTTVSSAAETTDTLLPTSPASLETHQKSAMEPQYILDVRFSSILTRLRTNTPPVSRSNSEIPFPNTTSSAWPIPMSLFMRTMGRPRQPAAAPSEDEDTRTVPGGRTDT
ncbi:hypothetical protein BDP27DRAFT_1292397 [Rhodocollybia butyracea]|uniref:DUF1746 domain-containing protein n=1 Tax=Rhodocollybia butyracea TaxID=206335 RepID=A0A9P5U962_9AGAR|nr:hypothetical protein BDP27DRAFT_1292397 [Rhodocollybia butyracea]